MNGAAYTAFSGLRAQMEALDIVSNNLANVNTAGFKSDKTFFTVLDETLKTTADPEGSVNNWMVQARSAIDRAEGSLQPTHRDLDVAIEGSGFIAVDTPRGMRYTRNGHLNVSNKSVLCAGDFPIVSDTGKPITLGPGRVTINQDGDVYLEENRLGRIRLFEFDGTVELAREGNSLFAAEKGAAPRPSGAKVRQGYLEQSNVNPMTCVVSMVSLMRQFESIQKSYNVLMNEINAKAIEKLSR